MPEPLPGFDGAGFDGAGFTNVRPLFTDELGVCYVADHAERGGEVAVHLLTLTVPSRPARRQFRSSCLAITALAGQGGVLTVHDAEFTAKHHPYLVTDVPAGTLARRLADGPLPAEVAAAIGVRLATTLATAHAAGVLHLDVRPANVARTADDSAPLLARFSVARAVSAAGQTELPAECLLHSGRELFGWDTPGPAADVYGLGSTLYTALAGQAPYLSESRLGRAALYQRVLRGGPPPIARPGIPPTVTTLIAGMMDPDPANRPDLGQVSETLATHASAGAKLTAGWNLTSAIPHAARFERLADPPVLPMPVPSGPSPVAPPPSEPALPSEPAPAKLELATVPIPPSLPSPPSLPAPPAPPALRRSWQTGPMLLIAAGLLALLAGFVWGIVTGSHPKPQTGPTVRATASATPISPSQLALYRATDVRASVRPAGVLVTWSAPADTQGVNAFLVIPKVPGQPRTQSVGRAGRSVIFNDLPKGHRYCFVVVTLIESAAGQASTAATSPVCTPARHRTKT